MKKALVLLTFVLVAILLASCLNITCTYEETVIPPTCTAEGYTVHTCSGCGDTYTDTPTEKVPHTYADEVVAPTCTAEGYTKHTCTVCGDNYNDTTTEKVPHTYADEVVAPTCTAEGYTKHTCTVCGDNYNDTTTEKVPHTYADEVVAPTCAAEGYTKHTCDCGESYNDTFVSKTSHRFNASACKYCEMPEITENITPDTEWYSADAIQFSVTTAEQLAGVAALVNSGTDFKNQVIYLEADIDLGWYEWIPIGNASYSFAGTFNGNEHTISSLKIHKESSCVGLFGNVSGSISNFNIRNASIYVKDMYENVSAVCGYATTPIKNVSVNGFIDAAKSNAVGAIVGKTTAQISNVTSAADVFGNEFVGGIAGSMAFTSTAFISEISNTGTVIGGSCVGGIAGSVNSSATVQIDLLSCNGAVKGTERVGGIFGAINAKVGSVVYGATVCAEINGDYYVGGIVGKAENVAISSCTNEGSEISATLYYTDGTNFFVYLGGYVGSGYSVDNCKNTVVIKYNSRGAYIGGIAGYLTNSANDCENTAEISGYSNVGGIVGCINTTAAITLKNLKNSANISGNGANVGGIIGAYQSTAATTLSLLENSGEVKSAGGQVGGIIGNHNNGTATLNASDLKNTGDVSGVQQVGGLFGYLLGSTSSLLKNSSSAANIVAEYKVGGVVGDTVTVTIKDCTNEGSTITATSWFTEGATDYVYLGGYAGYGYKISGCTNNADITYEGGGIYVGGIVGYAYNVITDCTNNGNITSSSSYVGGIAGYVSHNGDCTISNVTNTGDITGKSYVGGVIGALVGNSSTLGSQAVVARKNTTDGGYKYCSYHYHYNVLTIKNVSNSGNVTATGSYAAGIVGYIKLNASAHTSTYDCCKAFNGSSWWTGPCEYIGLYKMGASNITNTGAVSGADFVKEIFGSFTADTNDHVISTLGNYTVTGQITVNGEVKTGTYDVGANTNLTLSGRTVYTPPTEETETPEEGTEG